MITLGSKDERLGCRKSAVTAEGDWQVEHGYLDVTVIRRSDTF